MKSTEISKPALFKFLFSDTRMSWLWLIIRIYIGWEWLLAGWGKVNNPVWFGTTAGGAVKGFVMGSLEKTAGTHPDVSGWYADFLKAAVLPNVTIFSNMVAVGELLVGIALILGAFTGIAAFFGAFMNMNYLLAGTVSTNPIMLLLQLLLILAWKTAGFYGVDHYLLQRSGTYWQKSTFFKKKR